MAVLMPWASHRARFKDFLVGEVMAEERGHVDQVPAMGKAADEVPPQMRRLIESLPSLPRGKTGLGVTGAAGWVGLLGQQGLFLKAKARAARKRLRRISAGSCGE